MKKSNPIDAFSEKELLDLYRAGKTEELTDAFIAILGALDKEVWTSITPQRRKFLNSFAEVFFYLLTREDYNPTGPRAERLLFFNPVVNNLAALTPFKTTDPFIGLLKTKPDNLLKILILLNPRNREVHFKVEDLFAANPYAASRWYGTYFFSVEGFPDPTILENIRSHIRSVDERMLLTHRDDTYGYCFATYADPDGDRLLKRKLNDILGKAMSANTVKNRPDNKKIALVSSRWYRSSAVYKSCAGFIESLLDGYELTLIRTGSLTGKLGPVYDDYDRSWFKDVHEISFGTHRLDVSPILENDFGLVYFADIGMHPEDRYLANLRFAPIQAMGYGHPVSTFGAEIDYFIGGRDVERADLAERNYSERLVLIPGVGAYPVKPQLDNHQRKVRGFVDEPLLIACPWYAHKCCFPHLQNLRRIAERALRKVKFRFFVGRGVNRHFSLLPFAQELANAVGAERVEIIPEIPPLEYLEKLGECAFSLEAYPFGGYNTVVDALYMGLPVVSLEGDRFISRAGSALLRKVGLDGLVAVSDDDFQGKVLRMTDDPSYRSEVIRRLSEVDLEGSLFSTNEPKYFRKAIDYLMENHQILKAEGARTPIFIE